MLPVYEVMTFFFSQPFGNSQKVGSFLLGMMGKYSAARKKNKKNHPVWMVALSYSGIEILLWPGYAKFFHSCFKSSGVET